jgi:hypothetical protein
MLKAEIVDFFLIQKINLPIQLTNIRHKDLIFVYLQKEPHKRFGKCALIFIKMELGYLKLHSGKKDSNKLINFLEKQVKEF